MSLRVIATSTGTVSAPFGRGSSKERGLPAAHKLSFELEDGETTTVSLRAPDGAARIDYRTIDVARAGTFGLCPICLVPDPSSKEHVPPKGLGGVTMTTTCVECNNGFGSRVEASLQDWFDGALRVRVAGDGVAGQRNVPRLLTRTSDRGEPFVFFDRGNVDPEVQRLLDRGDFSFIDRGNDPRAAALAVLKSSYLAACLLLKRIPDTPRSKRIRELLVAARDRPKNSPFEPDPILDGMEVIRSYVAGNGVVALIVPEDDPLNSDKVMISLAGTIAASWPLERLTLTETEQSVAD